MNSDNDSFDSFDNFGDSLDDVVDGVDDFENLDRTVVARWGGNEIVLAKGFMAVPRTFLLYASRLGMSPSEIVFVLALMTFKWSAEAPFPSYERLASRLNVSIAQARKLARQLEEKRFLRRIARYDDEKGRASNAFDLTPLFDRLAFEALMEEKGRTDKQVERSVSR